MIWKLLESYFYIGDFFKACRLFVCLLTNAKNRTININAAEYKVVGGYAAVHYACLNNSVPMLSLLLTSGVDPNLKCQSLNGESPLHICCHRGYTDCAKELLKHGAHADITDNFGNNASFWAYKSRNEHMVKELQLPQSRAATAEEFVEILRRRVPGYVLPSLKKKVTTESKKGPKK